MRDAGLPGAALAISRFEKASVEALMDWKFAPAPELERNRVGCYTIFYRIKG